MMVKKTLPNELILGEVSRLIERGETVTLKAKGTSMLPFIVGGRDSVVLERPDELKTGMIVLAYVVGERYVLHRIIAIEGDKLTLMGDGNLKGVEMCLRKDVKAVASRIIKPSGEVDCHGRRHLRQVAAWNMLKPIRRWILAVYKRIFI